MKYVPNVDFIIKDWKESWQGGDITTLIHKMPRDNVIEIFEQPVSDDDIMISCPVTFADEMLDNPDSAGWLFDYGCYDEYDGFHWNGEKLQVIYKGRLISTDHWERITEELNK